MDRQHIDQILESNPIESVIGEVVDLKKRGSVFAGLSPFSKEKTPSFYVHPAKQFFKCFSSGKGGDVITFIMEHEGLDFMDAIRFLEKRVGIEVSETELRESDRLKIKVDNANAALQNLFIEEADYSYFQERGFSEATLKKWGVGYCPVLLQDVPGFSKLLVAASCDNQYGGSLFQDRVTIPIRNQHGQVIAFSGRAISDQKPKYINSRNHLRFQKSETLYGLDRSRPAILMEDIVWLVEGYTDVWSVFEHWTEAVVATMGTAMSKVVAKAISKMCSQVVIAGDNDAAGLRAVMKYIPELLKQGLVVMVASMPEGLDPDEAIKRGFVKPEPMVFTDYVRGLKREVPLKEFMTIVQNLRDAVSDCEDEVVKVIFLKQLQQILL